MRTHTNPRHYGRRLAIVALGLLGMSCLSYVTWQPALTNSQFIGSAFPQSIAAGAISDHPPFNASPPVSRPSHMMLGGINASPRNSAMDWSLDSVASDRGSSSHAFDANRRLLSTNPMAAAAQEQIGQAELPLKIHVKFARDSGARLRNARFASLTNADLSDVNEVLRQFPGVRSERLFSRPELMLAQEKQRIEAKTGRDLPDLNLWYLLLLPPGTNAEALVAALKNLPIIEVAYVEPQPAPPPDAPPPASSNFEPLQGYLNAAPSGIDSYFAQTIAGGDGKGVNIIDIEFSWNQNHEDLSKARGAALIRNGTPSDPFKDDSHGTAVLGEIMADRNGFGVTGISFNADLHLVNVQNEERGYDLANAINLAHATLNFGDVMLIEQQAEYPEAPCREAKHYMPMEFWQAFFDAIFVATSDGIVVVEAAGNGGCNLDDAAFEEKFSRAARDSGAIIVGAGAAPDCCFLCTSHPRSRLSFSNYSSRVDLQGWGQCVVTTGGNGDKTPGVSDRNQWYTSSFDGTSSAAPIVAGAVAALQGINIQRNGNPLSPPKVREVLVATGTPQDNSANPGHIGPLPDLRAAATTTPISLALKKSPVWTGNQAGPQDAGGHSWNDPAFDDSQWSTVTLPDTGPDLSADDRYYRSHFTWDGVSPLGINFATDDGLVIYVNGTPLGSWGNGWRQPGCVNGPSGCLVNFSIPPQAIPPGMLRIGDNVLAVDLWNGVVFGGNSFYLDVNLRSSTNVCPTISGTSPTSGAIGSSVTITGMNFTGVTAVSFSNNVTAPFAVNSDTQITAIVPSGAVTGPITVSNQYCTDAQTVTFTVTPTPQCDTLSFAAATNFAEGSNAYSLALGDFSGDGKLDLAVANPNANNVSILLGTGTGNFSVATNFAVGTDPTFVAVGDFNRDGKLDLATSNESGNVSILLGNGTGSFGAATSFAAGSGSHSLAVGDFNGDGKLDLATANSGADNVSILLGTGTGSFSAATNFVVGRYPISIATGDFNGDSKLDLATANLDSDNVSILLGTGTGSFSAATNFFAGTMPFFVAMGDLNRDGKLDLAVAILGKVSILLGTGTGSFGGATNFVVGDGPSSIAVGDFNGDGKLDLATANLYPDNVSILLGTGTGSFSVATNFAVGTDPVSTAAGDFNGDGKLDLATANLNSGSDNVSILLNDCPVRTCALGCSVTAPEAGSINNPISFNTATTQAECNVPVNLAMKKSPVWTGNQAGPQDAGGRFWNNPAFNDSQWSTVTQPDTGPDISADDRYYRSHFTWDGVSSVSIDFATDDGLAVYVNGSPLGSWGNGWRQQGCVNGPSYCLLNFSVPAQAIPPGMLRIGDNVLAIDLWNGVVLGGNSFYIDVALARAQLPVTYDWDFGDGSVHSSEQNPSHIYSSAGTYTWSMKASINGAPSCVKTGTIIVNPGIRFSSAAFNVAENAGSATITVSRVGDASGISTVNYSTSDSSRANPCNVVNNTGLGVWEASSRCDYLFSRGTLKFAAGETSKDISIPIIDDAYLEGPEIFNITLSNATGGTIGEPATATVTIDDNDAANGVNPINQAAFFVRQHYVDFLNREPDSGGLNFWTNEITSCGADVNCIEVKRINVSAAFFLSIEFQETGYLVYRMYKSGFGNLAGAPVAVRFTDFLHDTQQIGQGVQVGIGNWQAQLEANKQAYAFAFVQRSDFQTAFPNTLTADQFVTKLDINAGGVLSTLEKADLVAVLGTTPADLAKRASVLRSVAEDSDLRSAEFNRAFVLMQYFGYLRRNPNDAPDSDFSGYNFWLNKLNSFGGNFVNAEMVKAFILSGEYRQRFGP